MEPCRLTPKLSDARQGCRTAKALYLSEFTHLPPRSRPARALQLVVRRPRSQTWRQIHSSQSHWPSAGLHLRVAHPPAPRTNRIERRLRTPERTWLARAPEGRAVARLGLPNTPTGTNSPLPLLEGPNSRSRERRPNHRSIAGCLTSTLSGAGKASLQWHFMGHATARA
jgi:hypothetical protein